MVSKRTRNFRRFLQSAILKLRWLMPGIGVKRWVLVILIGTTILGLGLTVFLLDVYHTVPEGWWIPFIKVVALQFVTNRVLRALIFGLIGTALIILGITV